LLGSTLALELHDMADVGFNRDGLPRATLHDYGHSTPPFHSFYRMSGRASNDHEVTIDFDPSTNNWRMLDPDSLGTAQTDAPNPTASTATIKNGSWSATSFSNRHVLFPELGLQIPNLYFFLRDCKYQPFMTVLRTDNMTEQQIKEQSDEKWSPKSSPNVVMRTASFGRGGTRNLEVCARNVDAHVDGEQRTRLDDDLLVPLGLMAIIRMELTSSDSRCENHYD